MPSDVEQLELIKQQSLQQLADLRASPKPSYALDGQQVSWEQYAAGLERTVAWCERQLAARQPYEVRSRGVT